jgi:transposase
MGKRTGKRERDVAVLEASRLRAGELLGQGWSAARIATELDVAESTVYGWQRRWREGGTDALRSTGPRGRSCRLSDSQLAQLRQELLRGPQAHGYSTELWTLQRIGEVIRRLFQVRYTESAVWKLLGRMGWSPQRPARRAKERDEKRIANWKDNDWPRIKRGH